MKEIFEVHVMEIIAFEASDIYAGAGTIGGTSANGGDTSETYPNSASLDS